MNERRRVVVIGGGAAGFFAALVCAEAAPDSQVIIFEASPQPLAKVRVSGGGRCNVTHDPARVPPRQLVTRYPRGGRELLGPFTRFGPADTVAWFGGRGVDLKVEDDGRMFPITDSSETIIECLTQAAARAGVQLVTRCGVTSVLRAPRVPEGGPDFALELTDGTALTADRVIVATGGNKSATGGHALAATLGHTIEEPVPSLFTFNISDPRLEGLAGLAVPTAIVTFNGLRWREVGPVLITHTGLSGPAVLRLSAWAARDLHAVDYRATLAVDWTSPRTGAEVKEALAGARSAMARKQVTTANPLGLPGRLWERFAAAAGLTPTATWATLSNVQATALVAQVTASQFTVTGKSTNKEEFVTCGGVRLREVDFRTMESRVCPGLHFAGEVLDVDGVTGGFNFQAAWTTGWIAGRAAAGIVED